MTETITIVGGGLAGASAAIELRKNNYEGAVRIIGTENHEPYLRPPLSKEYLTGAGGAEALVIRPESWWIDNHIDLVPGRTVVALDASAHRITFDDGHEEGYDRLLLATGSEPRRLEIEGALAQGIHYLRTVEQSESLREAMVGGGARVVVVGAGWIGLEVAAAARGYGNEVTVIGREDVPLEGPLGAEIGGVFQRLHEQNGVTFRLSTVTLSFETQGGTVTAVVTDTGSVPADVVVIGVGAQPRTALASSGGLAIDNGVLVGANMRTDAPDIWAAGDVANAWHPVIGQYMRNEHWANAKATGAVAARSMLDLEADHDDIPYFYTDQYDLGMEYSGYPPLASAARIVYRGDVAGREFIAFWVADRRVVAGMNVNVWDVKDAVQQLVRSEHLIDEARLADLTVPLSDI